MKLISLIALTILILPSQSFRYNLRMLKQFRSCRRQNNNNQFARLVIDSRFQSDMVRSWNIQSTISINCPDLTSIRITLKRSLHQVEIIPFGRTPTRSSVTTETFERKNLREFISIWDRLFNDSKNIVFGVDISQLANKTIVEVKMITRNDMRQLEDNNVNFAFPQTVYFVSRN